MLPLHNYRSSYATGSVGVICKYGSHQDLIFYRVGSKSGRAMAQRRGIRISSDGGTKGALGAPN